MHAGGQASGNSAANAAGDMVLSYHPFSGWAPAQQSEMEAPLYGRKPSLPVGTAVHLPLVAVGPLRFAGGGTVEQPNSRTRGGEQ